MLTWIKMKRIGKDNKKNKRDYSMLTFPTIKELQSKQNELDELIHQQSVIEFECRFSHEFH